MALPYWIETMRTVPSRQDARPGSLLPHIGIDYSWPYLPPGTDSTIYLLTGNTGTVNRGNLGSTIIINHYAICFFSMRFSYCVPDTVKITATLPNLLLFDGIITGTQLAQGIDYNFWIFPDDVLTFRVQNLSSVNQRFGFFSQYLSCKTEADYMLARDTLEWIKFPDSRIGGGR